MNPILDSRTCFLCLQNTENSNWTPDFEGDSKLSISYLIVLHFWFQVRDIPILCEVQCVISWQLQEDELRGAVVCQSCWDKVNQFHQFYQEVKISHDQLKSQPLPTVIIKQEALDIEEEQIVETNNSTATVKDVDWKPVPVKTEPCEEQTEPPVAQEKTKRELKPFSLDGRSRFRKQLKARYRKAQDDVIKKHMQYQCDDCDVKFESFCTALQHRKREHNQASVKCCERQFKTRSMLHRHAMNPGPFPCETCGRVFRFMTGYQRHKKEVHDELNEVSFKCNRCSEVFTDQDTLKRHQAEHERSVCGDCGKQFRTRNGLQKHTKAVHQEPTDYICKICSKGFYRRSLFVEHLKTHEKTPDELKEQCEVCKKWLKNHLSWEKHVQRHQFEGQFKCDECDHVSVNLLSLKVHKKRRHGSDKEEYQCELCDKSYTRKQSLKEHVANAHTGEPLYECQYCLKGFFSNATMYAHRKKDHPQEWLQNHATKFTSREGGSNDGQ